MEDTEKPIDLEPLLSIYDYDEWMPELRERAAEYLRGLPESQYAALFSELPPVEVPDGDREAQVICMTTDIPPGALADSVHFMAVKTVSTLGRLIESELASNDGPNFDYETVGYWLKKNASIDQQAALIQMLDLADTVPALSDRFDILDWIVDTKLPAYRIQQAWERVSAENYS